MKKTLTLAALSVLVLSLPIAGQDTKAPTAQTAAEKKAAAAQRKADKEAAKRREKEAKAEEKERLKRPAQIEINASSERVGAILIRRMNARGYQLADEGKYRLVFQREVTGFKGSLASSMMGGDSPPLWTASFTLTELSGETTVSVDMAVIVRRRFGTPSRTDMNKHKDSRRDLDYLLKQVKYEAEAQ